MDNANHDPVEDEKLKSIQFEDAIEQIEQVIEKIESGEAGLEESLVAYERASKLIGQCRSILEKAQQRIVQLTADPNGKLKVTGQNGDTTANENNK